MASSNETISINEEEIKELKELYEKAPEGSVFKFKGKDLLKEYAKYLIEYINLQTEDKK